MPHLMDPAAARVPACSQHDIQPAEQLASNLSPAAWAVILQRHGWLVRMLKAYGGKKPVDQWHVLDFGCIQGDLLPFLLNLGFDADKLSAAGLKRQVLDTLTAQFPQLHTTVLKPTTLDYPAQCMDLIIMADAFSLSHDPAIRAQWAREIQRILKPGGLLLWWDHKPVFDEQREWQTRLCRWLAAWQNRRRRDEVVTLPRPVGEEIQTQSPWLPLDELELRMHFSGWLMASVGTAGMHEPMARLLLNQGPGWLSLGMLWPFWHTHMVAVLQKPED